MLATALIIVGSFGAAYVVLTVVGWAEARLIQWWKRQ